MIMVVGTVVFVACNKESEISNKEVSVSEAKTISTLCGFTPNYVYRTMISPYDLCDKDKGCFCGFNIDAVLSGDEACWLMMDDGDPVRFFLPKSLVLLSNAGVLIDSARTGAMTFHSDFEIESASMAKDLGIDLIPAGRYPAAMTMYNGDSAVCIYLDTVL